ncbi:MAG: hypothetical protein ACREID_07755, partial [Planctomycetota bacterium]
VGASAGAVLYLYLWVAAAGAQDAPPAEPDRVQELEQRVKALEESREALRQEVERTLADEEALGLGIVLRRGKVQASVQLFGDVGFSYANPTPVDRGNSAFFFGGVNAFAAAQVGDHFQVLSETVIKTREEAAQDRIIFDQERLWGSWTFSDRLYVKLGLEHGPISRWNRLYHHGRWLELTIERPMLARFETAGGFLPLHNAALEIGGRFHTALGRLEYIALVGNGRGKTAEDAHKISDRNDGKAFELSLGFAPSCVDGLIVGFNVRVDDIPPDPAVPARARSIRELIGGGYVEYKSGRWDILAELVYVEDRDRTAGGEFGHHSGYLQIGYRMRDRWTGYTRIDYRRMDFGDPYFAPLDRDLDRWELLYGVRVEITPNAAVKFEIGFGEEELDTQDNRRYFRAGFQLSWVF